MPRSCRHAAWKCMERESQVQGLILAPTTTLVLRFPRFMTVIRPDFWYGITQWQVRTRHASFTSRYQLCSSLRPTPLPAKSLMGHQTVSSPSNSIRRIVERNVSASPSGWKSIRIRSWRIAFGFAGKSTDASLPGSRTRLKWALKLSAKGGNSTSVRRVLSTTGPSAFRSAIVNVFTFVPAAYVRYSMLYQRQFGGLEGSFASGSLYVTLQCFAYGMGRYRFMPPGLPAGAFAYSIESGSGAIAPPARISYGYPSMAGSSAPSR